MLSIGSYVQIGGQIRRSFLLRAGTALQVPLKGMRDPLFAVFWASVSLPLHNS
jgi:hypothetical protein